MSKIRVVIADDHAVVRQGTRSLLEREDDIEVVGEAKDGEEAVKLIQQLKPDVAIVDVSMPKLTGVEVTKQVKPTCPSTAILILSAYDNDEYVFALLEAGAAGYLLKDVDSREVVDAVRRVRAGESVLHPIVARKRQRRWLRNTSARQRFRSNWQTRAGRHAGARQAHRRHLQYPEYTEHGDQRYPGSLGITHHTTCRELALVQHPSVLVPTYFY